MAKKIKRSPWYLKLRIAIDKETKEEFVVGLYNYHSTTRDYVYATREYNLDELIASETIELKLTNRVRNTRNDSYVKFEVVDKVPMNVKIIDPASGKQVQLTRGNHTYMTSTFAYMDSGLFLEARGSELSAFFKYYDCKSKTLKLPFKAFKINIRTESPSIVLNNGNV